MAVYKVNPNGSAPKNAVAGDTIVTAGGTYEVVDGSAYKGMSASQLKANGVGYNPTSGLYSKKVNDVNTNQVALMDNGILDKWLNSANQQAQASIDGAYNTSVATAEKAYNASRSDYEQSIDDVKKDYISSITRNNMNAYNDSIASLEGAQSRGLINSGLGQAMTNASLWGASIQDSEITRDRDKMVNTLKRDINTLTKNYNVTLSELERAKLNQEIEKLNDNQLQYLTGMLEVNKYNTGAINSMNEINVNFNNQKELARLQSSLSRYVDGDGSSSDSSEEYKATPESLSSFMDMLIARDGSIARDVESKFAMMEAGLMTPENLHAYLTRMYYLLEQRDVNKSVEGQKFNDDGKLMPNNKASVPDVSPYPLVQTYL